MLYPYGVGGFEDSRRQPKISMRAHIRYLLNIADGRFRQHPSFIFSAFNILQRREVGERTRMKVSRASFQSKARIYARLQVEAIQRVAERVEVGQYDFQQQDEKDVCDLMRDVHTINSTVEGSAMTVRIGQNGLIMPD